MTHGQFGRLRYRVFIYDATNEFESVDLIALNLNGHGCHQVSSSNSGQEQYVCREDVCTDITLVLEAFSLCLHVIQLWQSLGSVDIVYV